MIRRLYFRLWCWAHGICPTHAVFLYAGSCPHCRREVLCAAQRRKRGCP